MEPRSPTLQADSLAAEPQGITKMSFPELYDASTESNGRKYLFNKDIKFVSCCIGHHQDLCKIWLSSVISLALRESSEKRKGSYYSLHSRSCLKNFWCPPGKPGASRLALTWHLPWLKLPFAAVIWIQQFFLNFTSLSPIVGFHPLILIPLHLSSTAAEIPTHITAFSP